MAKFRILSIEPQADAKLNCDTFVLTEVDDGQGGTTDKVIGHFTVVLDAVAVNAITGTLAQRIAQYEALFAADPRIMGAVTAEEAADKINADVPLPVTVDL